MTKKPIVIFLISGIGLCLVGMLIITLFFVKFHQNLPYPIRQPNGSMKFYEEKTLYQILSDDAKNLYQSIFPAKTSTSTTETEFPQHRESINDVPINNVPEEKPATASPMSEADKCREIAMSLLPKEVTYTFSNTYLYDFDYSVTAENFKVLSEKVFGKEGLRRAENPGENINNYYGTDSLELMIQDLKITDSKGVILGDNIIIFLAEVDLGSEGVPIADTFSVPIKNAKLMTCKLDVPERFIPRGYN